MNRDDRNLENYIAWLEQHRDDPAVIAGAQRVGRLLAQGGDDQ